MYYENEIFDNYQALAKKHPDAAAELQNEIGDGEWQNLELRWYPNEEDFAIYDVIDGWYSNIPLDTGDFDDAPNLLNFFDFKALGRALVETWDSSCNFETESGEIITASYGW